MIRLSIPTDGGNFEAFACGHYYPYKIDGERNPKFDKHSGFVLSSKDPSNRDHGKAVQHFSDLLSTHLSRMTLPTPEFGVPQIGVTIVPSSTPGGASEGLTSIMKKVCSKDARLQLITNGLVRVKKIEKLARGGDRSIDVHKNSIACNNQYFTQPYIIIFDDVLTTGNSIRACCDIIRASHQARFMGLALARTTHD